MPSEKLDVADPQATYPDTLPVEARELLALLGLPAESPPGQVSDPGSPREAGDQPRVPGYEITGELARGGMGVVYAARDLSLARDVAVKTVLTHRAADPRFAAQFDREARLTAQLTHPGIPPVHALGTLPDGRPFLAMKLIRGRTLADILASRESERPELLGVFEAVCQAVGYAHSQGIIHRDLKPSNVMVGAFGEVQVMDWGLARSVKSDKRNVRNEGAAGGVAATRSGARDADADATQLGHAKGTPAYMPPEQARGEWDKVDARADVFSLGGILCTILAGQPPYTGSTGGQVFLRAETADLGEVFDRLRECGADPALVALCKQ